MPVALYISSQNVKLVYARGNAIEKYKTVPLPPGLVKDGRILQPQAVAEVINSLFNSLQLPRSRIIASITGISYIYRILMLPRVKAALQREAIERATQKEINVPLDELYIDWQIIADTGKEIEVFVLGIPRGLIDALIQTMDLAKVKLTAVDLKSLALARAVGQANALIVDFEPDWFDITIISKGIPVTLHSVAPKSIAANLEDNVNQLIDELNRTIDFYNLTHKENPILPSTPIILAGTLAADPAAAESILNSIGHPVQSLISRYQVPKDFPLSSYAVNLGLILNNPNRNTSLKHGIDSYNDINVDPLSGRSRIRTHAISIRQIIIPAVIIIAVLLVISISILRSQAITATNKLQAELERVNRNLYLGRLTSDEASSTQTTINELTIETNSIQKERELISGKGELAILLKLITDILPVKANYTDIASDAREVIIDGEAASRSDIINYANNLRDSENFADVRIALIDEAKNDETGSSSAGFIFKIVIER